MPQTPLAFVCLHMNPPPYLKLGPPIMSLQLKIVKKIYTIYAYKYIYK